MALLILGFPLTPAPVLTRAERHRRRAVRVDNEGLVEARRCLDLFLENLLDSVTTDGLTAAHVFGHYEGCSREEARIEVSSLIRRTEA